MSVICCKTGELIQGVKPVKLVTKIRKVTYSDTYGYKNSVGWEIVKEEWVHPKVSADFINDTPEVVAEIVRKVDMTKPRAKFVKEDREERW